VVLQPLLNMNEKAFKVFSLILKGCLDQSPSDIFIKVGSGMNEQFIKRIHEGEGLKQNVLDRYIDKGVQFLYVKLDLCLKFIQEIYTKLLVTLDDHHIDPKKKSDIDKIQEMVRYNIDLLNVLSYLVEMSNRAINAMISQSENSPKMHKLLNLLMKSKLSFRFKHTHITTFVALALLKKIAWGNTEHSTTISFSAFLHNISLPTDGMCSIYDQKEFQKANFSVTEKETFSTKRFQKMIIAFGEAINE
jgi:hypothetical protein